jgi:hypothetical protein
MRTINQLTAAKVRTAKAGRHGDGGGLYLEVSKAGGKSWVYMWKRGGKRRCMALGRRKQYRWSKLESWPRRKRRLSTTAAIPLLSARRPEPEPSHSPRHASTAMPTSARAGAQLGTGSNGCHRWSSTPSDCTINSTDLITASAKAPAAWRPCAVRANKIPYLDQNQTQTTQ